MDLFMALVADRVAADNVLRKVDALVDWGRVGQVLGRVLGPVRSRLGRAGCDVELMVRVLLLGQWHSLSDQALEHALRVRLDFMLFCGSSVLDHCPDHTTICRFRQALVRRGLDAKLLAEVNRQLAGHGLKVERAPVAVVDATIVESAARPRRHVEVMAEDRAEDAAPEMPVTERLSADPDARWLQKGSRCFFGTKGFIRTDGDGYVERVLARPANEGEAPHFPALVTGCTARRVLADKGLASAANRAHLAAADRKSGIMVRASRGHPLGVRQKQFNRLVARRRWVVEQAFGTLKRRFRGARSRYLTCRNVEAELTLKATVMNLLKAPTGSTWSQPERGSLPRAARAGAAGGDPAPNQPRIRFDSPHSAAFRRRQQQDGSHRGPICHPTGFRNGLFNAVTDAGSGGPQAAAGRRALVAPGNTKCVAVDVLVARKRDSTCSGPFPNP